MSESPNTTPDAALDAQVAAAQAERAYDSGLVEAVDDEQDPDTLEALRSAGIDPERSYAQPNEARGELLADTTGAETPAERDR